MPASAVQPSPHAVPPVARSFRLLSSGNEPPPRRKPPVVANGLLAMAVFLGTETMLFAALISAFLILRAGATMWPPADQPRLPIAVTGVNTLVLLYSAYTMQRAVAAIRRRLHAEMIQWLIATAVLGTTFLLVQGVEWVRLVRHGLQASTSMYGATFYTVIGFHGVHVLTAVITLLAVLAWTRRQSAERCQTRVAVCRLYWLFVVAVWPVLYVCVYLM